MCHKILDIFQVDILIIYVGKSDDNKLVVPSWWLRDRLHRNELVNGDIDSKFDTQFAKVNKKYSCQNTTQWSKTMQRKEF